uniref:Uncharacterized protein n=1 Tax=viral metagenome TaxID=1070528 RepID=A0A6C0F7D5_9ZZZZ
MHPFRSHLIQNYPIYSLLTMWVMIGQKYKDNKDVNK